MENWQTRGCSARGADMGRRSDAIDSLTGPLTFRHVPLDEGGYDSGGAYWGAPDDLYAVTDAEKRVFYGRGADATRAKFAHRTWTTPEGPTDSDIADMLNGYITCMLWSSTDGDVPLDRNHGPDDLADKTRAAAREDCEKFARDNASTILRCLGHGKCDWSLAGSDLWLTCSESGAGFGDGGWPQAESKILYEAAKKVGRADVYVGDDGKVYFE